MTLKFVKSFLYGENNINFNASLHDEILNRIPKASDAFGIRADRVVVILTLL